MNVVHVALIGESGLELLCKRILGFQVLESDFSRTDDCDYLSCKMEFRNFAKREIKHRNPLCKSCVRKYFPRRFPCDIVNFQKM